MAAWECRGCTAVYSVGAPACPQCGSTDYCEQGEEMPRIHEDRPPTYATDLLPEGDGSLPEVTVTVDGVDAGPGEILTRPDGPPFKDLGDADGFTTSVPDYDALTVPTLRGYLADRDLPTDGVKADLVARLQEDDASQDTEPQ